MKIFIVSNHKGFGKDTSIPKAIKRHEEHNGKLRKPYTVYAFEAVAPEDVWIDVLNWYTINNAKLTGQTEVNMKVLYILFVG